MSKGRIFIYANDIAILTGKSIKTAYRIYAESLILLNKPKGSKMTITEYCKLNDLEVIEVEKKL